MPPSDERLWIDNWKAAGPALEEQRRLELRRLTPEIVLKAVAGREQDWLDIRGVAARQADRLDEPLIERELQPLLDLKGDPDAAARVRQLLERR